MAPDTGAIDSTAAEKSAPASSALTLLYGHTVDWSTLLATALGGSLALVGGVLSPRIASRQAHEHWLRDRRAALYEELFVVLDAAVRSAKGSNSENMNINYEWHMETSRELSVASAKLGLYAS